MGGTPKPKRGGGHGGSGQDGGGFQSPPFGEETDPNVLALKARFGEISRDADRRAWWPRLPDRVLVFAWIFAIGSWAAVAYVLLTPWTFEVTARHLAAAINCDTARMVGLAPARRGEPGYWPWLDQDHDGVACEVWRGHSLKKIHSDPT